MEDKDKIAELFKDQLGSFEGNVRPELWSVISAQAGASASSAGSLSLLAKTLIGISVAAGIGGIGYFFYRNSNDNTPIQDQKTVVVPKSELKIQDSLSTDSVINKPLFSSSSTTNDEKNSLALSEDHLNDLPVFHQKMKDPDSLNNQLQSSSGIRTPHSDKDQLTEHIVPVYEAKKEETQLTNPADKIEETLGSASDTNEPVQNYYEQAKDSKSINLFGKLPNAFTPNGDGANDYLFLTLNEPVTEFSIVILDRQNNVVFKSNNPDFHWDGTDMRGFPVEFGTYLYYVTGKDVSGHMKSGKTLLEISGN